MVFIKFFIAGAILACFVGAGSLAVLGIDEIADGGWMGRGGGCRGGGYYNDNGEEGWEPPCHRDYDGDEEYCPYHEEYFNETEWEEHLDDCPMYDEDQ
ncbi:MAG: hypothetical protein ACMUHM_05825 [Thermoplasmatota archaeon]